MNCGSSCPAQWQSGWNSAKWVEGTKRFPGSEWLLLVLALQVASQDVAEDVTKKRLSFLKLVILSELSKGEDEDTFHRELDSIELPNSGVVR